MNAYTVEIALPNRFNPTGKTNTFRLSSCLWLSLYWCSNNTYRSELPVDQGENGSMHVYPRPSMYAVWSSWLWCHRILAPPLYTLTYSVDTWGNKVRDDIVNVHIKICKYVACLHQHVANCFALSECGRLPRSINYKSKCVKNFDILYRSSRNCILGHFKAYFEDNNFIFSSVCQAKK